MHVLAGLPRDGTAHRKSPLALAVLLHAALIYAAAQGLTSGIERPEPPEVVISLVSPRTDTPTRTPRVMPVPKQSAPSPEPVPRPVSNAPPALLPLMRETHSPVMPAPVITAPLATSVPAQESRVSPAPPASVAVPIAPAASAAPVTTPVVQTALAAPAQAAPRGPVTVSSVEYLQPPKPDYPRVAKRAGEQGKVVLRILIDDKGLPERVDIQQSAGYTRLDEAARAAALRAVFKPHLEDGQPVSAYVLVPINFALK